MNRPAVSVGVPLLEPRPPQPPATSIAAHRITMKNERRTDRHDHSTRARSRYIVPRRYDAAVVPADKRQLILDAAVRVFARKGYHTSRVGDIAEEAGVAHGLLYHYFDSKEELLDTIFRNTWTLMLDTISGVETLDEPARETLRKVAAIVLRAW